MSRLGYLVLDYLVASLKFYGADIAQHRVSPLLIIKHFTQPFHTQALNWSIEDEVCSQIALRGKRTPRLALRLLESTRMTAMSENATSITMKHFDTTCDLESIDAIGLTENENKYLRVLYENGSKCRLNVIASRIGLHPKHISEIIESYLIREGLVTKENSCRILTPAGLEHLRNNQLEDYQ